MALRTDGARTAAERATLGRLPLGGRRGEREFQYTAQARAFSRQLASLLARLSPAESSKALFNEASPSLATSVG